MHPEARHIIEEMQPHGRQDRAALRYLEELQNFDKHRTLHLLAGVATSVAQYGEPPFDAVSFRPFKHGDKIASGPIPTDPKRDNDPTFTFGIAFGDGPPAMTVSTALAWIGRHIEIGVIPPLLPYL